MSPDDEGKTLPDTAEPHQAYATTEPGATPTRGAMVLPEAGYALGEVIGHGGMGEVLTAHDQRIGRDVAIKRMRSSTPSDSATIRFLREARIQARLDHPAIVPVYELDIDADGRPYFTMKRLAGVTLAQRLSEHVPVKPLLRAFVDVCLAIEFAHARGVVHRDLKPANIMLGDYGEVYVLDWGIARVLADRDAPNEAGDIDTLEGTKTGDLLGTPGYMAPEQIRGEPVGPATDVYALGAILFEILAGEPLHPRGTAALGSTLSAPQHSPGRRVPRRDIAPELDLACFAALGEMPGARPTARELRDRIQSYLDGDRDVEQRRALAAEQLELARQAFDSGDPEARATAMNCAGRALALHPESSEAARLVTSLIVEPPRILPAELVKALAEEDRRVGTVRLRLALFSLLGVMSMVLLLPLTEIRNWTTLGVSLGAFAATALFVWSAYVRGRPNPFISLIAGFILSVGFTRVLGPFVLTPVIIAGCLLAITANAWLYTRPLVIGAWLLAVTIGPLILESAGLLAPTWSMVDGGVVSKSAIMTGVSDLDAIELVLGNLILLATVAGYGLRLNRNTTDASHKLYIQAWHLGHLLPSGRIGV
jgi:serine/threonine-protein kinase